MASDAVGSELVSKVVGYKIVKGNFNTTTPNLPQRIAIIGEANTANQLTITPNEPVEITSAQQAGQLFGFGSPIHIVMRILRPFSGPGVAGIPTIVYPQLAAVGSTAEIRSIELTGTATSNATHTIVIGGRRGLDGVPYDFTVNTGDTAADIYQKIGDAVSNVLGCPYGITYDATDDFPIFTSKWTGLTARDLELIVDTNGNDAGITYAVSSDQMAAGTPSIAGALANFGNDWNTIVINTYGAVSSVMTALEDFNGIPDPVNPTGRYAGIVMKPFFAFTGTINEEITSVTDAKKTQVTIAVCPAPNSPGLAMEAAANFAFLQSQQAQNNPHLDISGQYLPDMPTPYSGNTIGQMDEYINRDAIVKKGHSTVEFVSGRYKVADFVTTYHPDGETPPQFRYVRNLVIDFNMRFGYYLLEQTYVVDHVIATNDAIVTVPKVITPAQWIQILNTYAKSAETRALIVDKQFFADNLQVNISSTNPDRFETKMFYKRSNYARILSTDAVAGFNTSNNN